MPVLLHPPLQGLTPWRLLDEAPGSRSALRWRASSEDGSPVDVVRPLTAGSGSPGRVRRDFAQAHRAVHGSSDPAVVRVHAVIEEPDGVAVVRQTLADATLEEVHGPLPGEIVAAIGARLFPAVLELGGALGGTVLGSDVGLDDAGWVVLAPLGPHTSHVERSVAGAAAPEAFEGSEPDGRAALFGLGALLYRLATGRTPPTGTAPTAPSAWNHRVSPELDRAILRLLDPEPDRRPSALPDLQAAAGAPTDLRPLTRRPRQAAPAKVSRRGSSGQPLVLAADALASMDPRARSAAAGFADVPIAAVDALAEAGLPLVIDRSASSQTLAELTTRAREELGVDAFVPRPPRIGPVPWLIGTLALASVPAATALVLAPFTGWLALLPGAVASAAVGVFGAWQARRSAGVRAGVRAADEAWSILERGRDERRQWPAVAAVDARIARLRRDLAHADLPATADGDVRDALRDLERRLDAMIGVLQTAERALGSVDRTRLGARLLTLERSADPAHREAREAAARTAADLADIESRRDRQLGEIHTLESALDELAGALSSASHEPADAEVERLARTARLLRSQQSER